MQTCQLLPNVLLINSSDSHMVESTLRNQQLDNKIRNRMNKYLYALNYIQCADQNQQYCFNTQGRTQKYAESQSHGFQTQDEVIQNQSTFSNVKTNSREQTKNNTAQINKNKQDQQKYKNNQKIPQNRNFTTSRYLNEKKQKQNVVKTKNLNLSKQQSKSRSKNKSILSTNSKPFQKIQLKSVKRVNQKQKNIKQRQKNLQQQFSQKDEERDKHKKDQKEDKMNTNAKKKNQTLVNKGKRYTISHRDNIVRRDQAVSNQISQIKQNSRIVVSRVRNHQNSSKSQQKNKQVSRSRFKVDQIVNGCSPRNCKQRCSTCERCQRCERCDRNRTSRINNSRLHFRESSRDNRLRDLQLEFQSNHHNLVQQTVQKSSDFLQMIRMMSQQ